jgi:branched-chain amino acid transport system substrate-binding protein
MFVHTTRRSRPALIALAVLLAVSACVESTPEAGESTTTIAESTETTAASAETTQATTSETTTGEAMDAPEEIVIGNPIALTGPNNAGASLSQIPTYDLWAADVNAAGGIYVAEYDQQIPVRIERVDDTSDVGTAVQLVQQMLEEGDVDFIFPPWGTASNVAIAPIVSEFQSPVMGCTVSSKDLADSAADYPYFYTMLNQGAAQGDALVQLAQELGIGRVAVIHHDDLHGIEFAEDVVPALEEAGIEIAVNETYPVNTEDLSQTLRAAQSADVDALLAFSYPPETFLMTGQMMEIGFNPDLFYATVGVAFPAYRDTFGPAAEGIMGAGVWNPNVEIEGAQDFFDRHVGMHGTEPDRWASAACYASGEVLQQAIEAAGTLDPVAVKEALDTTEFSTILGDFRFENQFNPVYPGQVGQWQNGEFEIVSYADDRTAEPVYPKAEWPAG